MRFSRAAAILRQQAASTPAAHTAVQHRDLADYDRIFGTGDLPAVV